MILICDYCGKTTPIDDLIRVRWKGDRHDNTYCQKCFPEVKKNRRTKEKTEVLTARIPASLYNNFKSYLQKAR